MKGKRKNCLQNFDHAIEIANSTHYGLPVGIYTNDVSRAFAAIRRLEAGVVIVNSPTMGVEVVYPLAVTSAVATACANPVQQRWRNTPR
jgi:aldehyde dehydrogenase (NAD+)